MERNKLVRLALITSLGLSACTTAAISADSVNGQDDVTTSSGISTPDYTNPAVLENSMMATASSVDLNGYEGLMTENFPEKGLKSQHVINSTWMYDLSKDNQSSTNAITSTCDSTVIDMPEINGKLILGIWHCFSDEHVGPGIATVEQQMSPNSIIQVSNVNLNNIIVDGVVLDRSQFGLSLYKDASFDWNGPDGIAAIFISNDTIDANLRTVLEDGAYRFDEIWFDAIPAESKFFEICTPTDTNLEPVVMVNGNLDTNQAQTNSMLYTTPLLSGIGCSGAGLTATFNGGSYLVGVHAGGRHGDPIMAETAVAYKLSGIGRQNLLQKVTEAQADFLSRTQP